MNTCITLALTNVGLIALTLVCGAAAVTVVAALLYGLFGPKDRTRSPS